MKTEDLKTIDITTLCWFDRTYGNTYFAQKIVLNYGLANEDAYINPFQYGYNGYEFEALKYLASKGVIDNRVTLMDVKYKLGVIVRSVTHENCLKRELKNLTL